MDKNQLTVDQTHNKRFEALPGWTCLSTHMERHLMKLKDRQRITAGIVYGFHAEDNYEQGRKEFDLSIDMRDL